jgi:LPS-assembly protein
MRSFLLLLLLMLSCASAPQLAAQAPPDAKDKGGPLYLLADVLTYEADGKRVILRGSVEMYYDGYVLTADEVVYDDRGINKLIAQGNVQLKDPSGNVTRADRIEASDDLRKAFADLIAPR